MHIFLTKLLTIVIIVFGCTRKVNGSNCGCKSMRYCYEDMVNDLREHDETSCIEDAGICSSSIHIYLTAIKQYCGNYTQVLAESSSHEGRHLYEVIITFPKKEIDKDDNRPVIVIDAGQEGDSDSVSLALYLIEQLLSCQENREMLQNVRWVILPSTNPDGMEYSKYQSIPWRKNLRPSSSGASFGVDISRNFEGDWSACPTVSASFSPIYPGDVAASENETIFIQGILNKYRKDIKAYLSLRRDGHSISYSYGFDDSGPPAQTQVEKVAGAIAARVNQRAGSVHLFTNQSIYKQNGKPRCGHSVDYAHTFINIMYAYEMRVFLGYEGKIMAKFQSLPRGYEGRLRSGYYNGIKELYNIVIKDTKLLYN